MTPADRTAVTRRPSGHHRTPPGLGGPARRPTERPDAPAGRYGAQGAVTAQLTSSVHEVALSKAFEPPLLAV